MVDKYEDAQRTLDPNRREAQRKARMEADARLASRGITPHAGDLDEEVADLLDAVERFEEMVESLGGDSMLEDAGTPDPDDADFVLPRRAGNERATAYQEKVLVAIARLRTRMGREG